MKQFMAVYVANENSRKASGWDALSDAELTERRTKGEQAWGQWVHEHRDAIVDVGKPLGKTLRASKSGVEPFRNALTAYTIVQASSHEAAVKMFEKHPHFMIFPGDSVEVMECLPLPGQ
ncbi:hypothetical protein [Dyella sp. C11]|uniref:hypothetical protein n=1 Tax=Dyella sp. C11 TaxID=2126991 RepID=UPI0018E5A37B|nr:hypothetical protein [Dyella sp. C11]